MRLGADIFGNQRCYSHYCEESYASCRTLDQGSVDLALCLMLTAITILYTMLILSNMLLLPILEWG